MAQPGAQQINTEFPEELKFLGSKQDLVGSIPMEVALELLQH